MNVLLSACAKNENAALSNHASNDDAFIDAERPFAIPKEVYQSLNNQALNNHDEHILHPANYLASLTQIAETSCEKEKLRRLVITINMYSIDVMNQSYYFETKSSGGQVLEKSFPEIKKLYGEGGTVINSNVLSDHLRSLHFECDLF